MTQQYKKFPFQTNKNGKNKLITHSTERFFSPTKKEVNK